MRKTLNLQASAMTAEAKAFMLAGGADSLVLWAPQWGKLEPQRTHIDETQWAALDENVRWAHGKLQTFIAVPSATPPWHTAGWRPETISLWADYLKRVMDRYPHTTVIVQNEPDYAGIPAATCAQLMKIAAGVAHETGHTRILGPAAATIDYSIAVLWQLRGWKQRGGVQVGFAFHDYIGVGRGQTWRLSALLAAMRASRWQDGQKLWLTELGYIFKTTGTPGAQYPVDPGNWRYADPLADQEQRQLDHTTKHYQWAQDNGNVQMWAGYEYVDSLWGGWASGLVRYDGGPHPLHDVWLDL